MLRQNEVIVVRGTTWVDTVGGNDGTLTNGPTFSSANGGCIVFDGSNDQVYLNTASSVLYIGRGVYGNYNHFNGKVSQVSLYDKELTADEIRRNYLSTKERYQ
jgi:hypothetical protein